VFVLSLFLHVFLYEVLGSLLDVSHWAAKCSGSSLELAGARVMCWASLGDVGCWLCAWGWTPWLKTAPTHVLHN